MVFFFSFNFPLFYFLSIYWHIFNKYDYHIPKDKNGKGAIWEMIFYISQNFIMARFAAFERSILHQILKTASISP